MSTINDPTLQGVFRRIDRIEDLREGYLYLVKSTDEIVDGWEVAIWGGDSFCGCLCSYAFNKAPVIYEIEKAEQ